MVNTRSGNGVDQPTGIPSGRARASQAPPPPPRAEMGDPQQNDMQALIAAQTQLLQTMATQMTNMQNQINHQQQQIQHQ